MAHILVGNISGATGVEACYEVKVTEQSGVISDEHEIKCETQHTQVENEENESEIESVVNNMETCEI